MPLLKIVPLRFIWRKRKIMLLGIFILAAMFLFMVVGLRVYSAERARGLTYTLDSVPSRPVAIIFGAYVYPNGEPSDMLVDRVEMGAELYKAGRVEALLLTGDNHIDSYNEPEAMRQYALSLGVPDSALVLDYAGFRTYDSCYRARDIFRVDEAILVTQAYHLDRALLTCNGLEIDAVGVAADAMRPAGYARRDLYVGQLREFPSTVSAVFDLMRKRKPFYLGEPLPIFARSLFERGIAS